ncbi:MAG: hypothetical protein ACI4IW_01835 [Oscillospiraceae bacterium]
MNYMKSDGTPDEIKGRECADYIREFCPERLLRNGMAMPPEQETEKTDDDSQFSV